MPWYQPTLEAAIRTRLLADTGIGGLFQTGSPILTGCFNATAPAAQAYPFVVLAVAEVNIDDTMRTRSHRATVEVLVAAEEQASGIDSLAVANGIIGRIMGDWEAQPAGTAPTYGLDRFQPDITATGWTSTPLLFERFSAQHQPGQLMWSIEFGAWISKAGA